MTDLDIDTHRSTRAELRLRSGSDPGTLDTTVEHEETNDTQTQPRHTPCDTFAWGKGIAIDILMLSPLEDADPCTDAPWRMAPTVNMERGRFCASEKTSNGVTLRWEDARAQEWHLLQPSRHLVALLIVRSAPGLSISSLYMSAPMASALLQSRISAFEALSAPQDSPKTGPPKPVSLIDEVPQSAEARRLVSPITPRQAAQSPSPRPTPTPSLEKKSSIDLQDWVLDDGLSVSRSSTQSDVDAGWGHSLSVSPNAKRIDISGPSSRSSPRMVPSGSSSPPLIMLQSPPKSKPAAPPQLPPRRPSYNSLRSVSSEHSGAPPSVSRSDSLTVEASYLPLKGPAPGRGHAQASSISSFHSVSLSSDGGDPRTPDTPTEFVIPPMEDDSVSIDSYDHLSTTSTSSPTASRARLADSWQTLRKPDPPKLPPRTTPRSSASGTPVTSPPRSNAASPTMSQIPTSYAVRRAPPAPPVRSPKPPSSRASLASTTASDRSSIISSITTTSRTSVSSRASATTTPKPSNQSFASRPSQLSRPTPVPPAARKRYEAVFTANVLNKKRNAKLAPRQAAGWRGLSVDLVTSPEAAEDVRLEDRLEGAIVREIWIKSRLDRTKLKQIWAECDLTSQGSLDRDAFVTGMWRIDEELRRAQIARQTAASLAPSAYRNRPPRRMASTASLRR
ncbi:hypothetical protein PUNSTDRAFT_127030 [Punctularia strigosozonata HHB-11173 SS5]|uniref:uncharacterized protein n=1 Tax=Punctularia strigosozonata (strain HHB-11173) TaxID=741275 RepID=UPI000441733E|nr:uncharacterized protein PUNSTDRAFT_127030 [Punctularia strigosozonata HHB-11173 SS5]EIN07244.1 hypothetical protein PUNSTDRAFT_127030 [Punctularia strigosozonata HHB-11173 SS5]